MMRKPVGWLYSWVGWGRRWCRHASDPPSFVDTSWRACGSPLLLAGWSAQWPCALCSSFVGHLPAVNPSDGRCLCLRPWCRFLSALPDRAPHLLFSPSSSFSSFKPYIFTLSILVYCSSFSTSKCPTWTDLFILPLARPSSFRPFQDFCSSSTDCLFTNQGPFHKGLTNSWLIVTSIVAQ